MGREGNGEVVVVAVVRIGCAENDVVVVIGLHGIGWVGNDVNNGIVVVCYGVSGCRCARWR